MTEEDTFNKLRRISRSEMKLLLHTYFYSSVDDSTEYTEYISRKVAFLKKYNWTLAEINRPYD